MNTKFCVSLILKLTLCLILLEIKLGEFPVNLFHSPPKKSCTEFQNKRFFPLVTSATEKATSIVVRRRSVEVLIILFYIMGDTRSLKQKYILPNMRKILWFTEVNQ